MAYLASELITNAFTLSNIVAIDLETVSADQTTLGLRLLNVLLDFKSTDTRFIPYYDRFTFNMVIGQETYFIPGLNTLECLTFNLGTVRFPMIDMGRREFFGSARVNNIESLPYSYRFERTKGGANIFLYFLPVDNYVAQLSGKFNLTDVNLFTDLSLVYDGFYIEYLRYGLMQLLCMEYDKEVSPQKLQQLLEYETKVMDTSPPDLYMNKMSTFGAGRSINYGTVNYGKGWTVPT